MATVYWTGDQTAVAVVYTCTVSATGTGGTLSVTLDGKTLTYTATGTDTVATTATNAAALFKATTAKEFSIVTFANPSSGVVTATGPADGRPVTLTWARSGSVTVSGTPNTPTTAATSPNALDDGANYSGGSVPSSTDSLIFEGARPPAYYGLAALTATGVKIYVRASYTGSIGLADRHPNGFDEFLPVRLETGGTVIDVRSAGNGKFRFKGTGVSAVAVTVIGTSATETVEVTGLPASSTLVQNGGGVVVAPLNADTCALSTAVVNGRASFRSGVGLTLGTATFNGATANLSGGYTTLNVTNGASVRTWLAAAGTTTNVPDGTLTWGSTGSVGTYAVGSAGFLDFSAAPTTVPVTAGSIADGGRLDDPYKLTGSYNLTVTNLSKVKLNVGVTRTVTYA